MRWGQAGELVSNESYPVSALVDGQYVATGWVVSVTAGDVATGAAPWVVCADLG